MSAPRPNHLDRRRFLLSVAGLAALAALPACASSDQPRAAGATSATGGDFPRTVRHDLGETTVGSVPQRIVCGTDGGELCSLLALGARPVGYGQRNDPPRPWLGDLSDGIDSYDLSVGDTNFERLAAWDPDLVLVQNGFATPDNLALYEQIAPAVVTSFIDWRVNLRQVAEAVGLEDRARELEAETDAAVVAVRERLPASAQGLRVNAVAAYDDGTVQRLNDQSPLGKVAADLGLAPLPAQEVEGEAVDELSLERLADVDADLLLLLHFSADGDGMGTLRQNGLFQRLEAVRRGAVVDLTEDESQQAYFDSVLTVQPNAALLERLVRQVAG